MSIPFANLDGVPIVVEFTNDRCSTSMHGVGRLRVTENGNELHVEISNADDSFTLILEEAKWDGSISQLSDGTHRIQISVK